MKNLEIKEIKKDNLYEIYVAHKKLARLTLQHNAYHLYFYGHNQDIRCYQFKDLLDAKTFLLQHFMDKDSLCQGIAEREQAHYQREASTFESLKRLDSEYYIIRSKHTWVIRDYTTEEDVGNVYRGRYGRNYIVRINDSSIFIARDLESVMTKVNVLFNNPDQLALTVYEFWLAHCREKLKDIADWK